MYGLPPFHSPLDPKTMVLSIKFLAPLTPILKIVSRIRGTSAIIPLFLELIVRFEALTESNFGFSKEVLGSVNIAPA